MKNKKALSLEERIEEKKRRIKKAHPWHYEECRCGHLIVWMPYLGYKCSCFDPKPKNL